MMPANELARLRDVAGNFPRGQNLPESEANYNYELFLDTFSPRTVIDLIDLLAEKDDNDKAHGVMIRELQRRNTELGVEVDRLRDQRNNLVENWHALRAQVSAMESVHAEYFDMDADPLSGEACPEPEDVWRYDRDFRAALCEGFGGAK